VKKTGFAKTKRPGFSSPYLPFVIRLWACLLAWVHTTYESACVNFFQRNTDHEINWTIYAGISQVSVEDSLGLHEISEKFSRNSSFLKFHPRISTEFGTKRDKFQVKRMSIHPRKKSNSFTHTRTFLSAMAVTNKKFIVNPVRRIWGSNLSQNSTDTVTNVW